MDNLDAVQQAMAVLISSDTKPIGSASSSPQSYLQEQLASKLAEFDEILKVDYKEVLSELETNYEWQQIRTCQDITWRYTQYCVSVLKLFIETTLKDGPSAILSVNTQKMVESLVQFIVCLGICPNLIPGVGVPLAKRSRFAALVENRTRFAHDCDVQLICCIKAILGSTKVTSLSAVVLTKHLSDLLASLLQICHAPRKKVPPSSEDDPPKPPPGLSVDDKLYCQQELQKLLERTYQPLLVQELLCLQSGSHPKAPRWIKRVCGNLLSDILLKPNGVTAIIKGTLQTTTGLASGKEWQQCEGLGRLVANCPKQIPVAADYYKHISKQVLDLFHANDESLKAAMCHTGASCITAMYSQHPEVTQQLIVQPLLQPLYKCLASEDTLHSNVRILVDEKELSQCLKDMHHLYMYNGDPNSSLRTTLQPVICPLFHLYCHTKKGISPLRSILRDILSVFFKSQKTSDSVRLLYCLALPVELNAALPQLREDIQFINDSEGNVSVVMTDFQRESSDDNDDEVGNNKMDCVVELIQVLNNESITADFFIQVLKELSTILADDFWSPRATAETTEGKTLLEVEKNLDHISERYNHAMNVLSLISTMCEELGTAVLHQTLHILEFAETTLQRMCEICEQSGEQLDALVADTLTMTLGLIAMLYQPTEMESEVKEKFQKMTSVLRRLSEVCQNGFLQQMAADLYITIATHCAVKPNLDKHQERAFNKPSRGNKNESRPAEKMQQSNRRECNVRDTTAAASQQRSDQALEKQVEFEDLCQQLKDPCVPVKAHAIRALTKLLVKRDNEALGHKDKLFQAFQESLESDDSFLYLSAIQGVVALVDISAQTVLPILCKQFSDSTPRAEGIETRMKIGEALVRSARVLGAMLPAYVKPLIATLLVGVKDSDPGIRASSLSNVAEVCYVIKVAVTPVIHEIISCVHDVVKTDKESEVRRAAVHVIRQLLNALQDDSLQVLQDVMKEMYSILKYAVQHDKDEITRMHAGLALEELDSIMKTFIFPKQSLTKKITVLP